MSFNPSKSNLTLFLQLSLEEGELQEQGIERFLMHCQCVSISSNLKQKIMDAPVLRLGIHTLINLSITSGYYMGTNVENSMEIIPNLDVTMDIDNERTSSGHLDTLGVNILQTNLISNTTTLADLKHIAVVFY